MEDFSSIVWVVFVIFSIVVSYAGRKQEKTKQPQHEETRPDRMQGETPAETVHPAMTERQPSAATREATRKTTAETQRHRQTGHRKAPGDVQSRLAGSPTTDAAQEEAEQTKIPAATFDLRQAVVYAEILKPKFEEE